MFQTHKLFRFAPRTGRLCSIGQVGAFALALIAWGGFSSAGSAANPAGEPSASAAQGSVAPAGEPAVIQGFRSAQFGMTEAQVQQAITADFKPPAKDIARVLNEAERTTALSLEADNLLPAGGKARISYILGFQTQKLIQVNIGWSIGSGKAASPETLVATANTLRQHFLKKSYKPNSVLTNAQLPDGSVVVFRGSDMEGRMVLLVLNGEKQVAKSKDAAPTIKPTALLLSYIKDVEHPDVFQIRENAF